VGGLEKPCKSLYTHKGVGGFKKATEKPCKSLYTHKGVGGLEKPYKSLYAQRKTTYIWL